MSSESAKPPAGLTKRGEKDTISPRVTGDLDVALIIMLGLQGNPIMLNSLVRKILLDAIASGPPYRVPTRYYLGLPKMMELMAELERRRLVTPLPCPRLTEAGIAEAKWLHVCPLQRDDEIYYGWPADERLSPTIDSYRSKNEGQKPVGERPKVARKQKAPNALRSKKGGFGPA